MQGREGGTSARGRRVWIGALAGLLLVAGGAARGQLGAHIFHASQKGQAFRPGELTLKRGDTVDIVNDDGDILHHAYVESPSFSFDSGDQEPGTTVAITFPVSGTFNVLCGIHPKMRMKVQVQ